MAGWENPFDNDFMDFLFAYQLAFFFAYSDKLSNSDLQKEIHKTMFMLVEQNNRIAEIESKLNHVIDILEKK